MKKQADLYIAGVKVDIDDDSLILFNYTRETVSDPTAIKNSYSHSVKLKGTPTNNKLFGSVFRLDRRTIFSEDYKGVYFDAMRRTPFEIYDDHGDIVESGYVKLTSVRQANSEIEYNITLYGGLGGFFYSLSYNDDGSKKTLADLKYVIDSQLIDPKNYFIQVTPQAIKDAWKNLPNAVGTFPITQTCGLINFMPAYNGCPDKFDANKVYYKPYSKYRNCPNLYVSKDGYTAHPDGDGGIIVEMKNKHNEWEMQDLRSYLQRPVIRFSAILDAITQSYFGGYKFVIDESCNVFTNDIVQTDYLWLTLALINWEKYHTMLSDLPMSALLENSLTPADYLVSYAKMMGHVFVTDPAERVITMMSRDKFFKRRRTEVIDLSNRIDITSIEMSPCIPQSKYYVWETENYGEEAKKYEERYGKKFGSKTVNTGYEFDAAPKKMLQNFAFKGACDVVESNLNYQIYGGDADAEYGDFHNYLFKFAMTEEVSWKLYKQENNELVESTFTPLKAAISRFDYNKSKKYDDIFPKVQLHGTDNKPEDGSNVLVAYIGNVESTVYGSGSYVIADVQFYLTEDASGMLNLNGGRPCWNYYRNASAILVSEFPSFRRYYIDPDTFKNKGSLDFGAPQEVFVHDYDYEDPESQNNNVYELRWKGYIEDLLNVDSKMLKCKVNLQGLQVNDELLGRFFWFDGCLWILSKLQNYSITTTDLTECEFIKVKEVQNYTSKQTFSYI